MRSPTSACFVLTLLIMLSRMRVPGATLTLPGAGSVRCFNASDDWADVEPEGNDGFCGGAGGSWARIDVASKHEQKRPFSMRNFLILKSNAFRTVPSGSGFGHLCLGIRLLGPYCIDELSCLFEYGTDR